MKIMILKDIRIKYIQGIKLVDALWESTTGRVQAISRLASEDNHGLVIEAKYKGTFKYTDLDHVFSPKLKVTKEYQNETTRRNESIFN